MIWIQGETHAGFVEGVWGLEGICYKVVVMSAFHREVWNRNVCGLWRSDTRPIHSESLPGPRVARCVSEVHGMQSVPG